MSKYQYNQWATEGLILELKDHLKSVSREELQNAIAKLNFASQNAENSALRTIGKAKDYEILDEVINTLQQVGATEEIESAPVDRLMGMKLILEALIMIAESRNSN